MHTEWAHGMSVFEGSESSPKGTLVLTAFLSKEEHGLCGVASHSSAVDARDIRARHLIVCVGARSSGQSIWVDVPPCGCGCNSSLSHFR
jgi:hypothetical protein